MTDYEKAVVMAYTGTTTLVGKKLDVFYRYIADKLGRPVYSHELASEEVIKRASFEDFRAICRDEPPLQKPLTLEEACGSEEPCVFMEYLTRKYLYAADICIEQYDTNVCICTFFCSGTLEKASDYNKTWRCWATNPTDEERAAAKWEE